MREGTERSNALPARMIVMHHRRWKNGSGASTTRISKVVHHYIKLNHGKINSEKTKDLDSNALPPKGVVMHHQRQKNR